MKYIDKLCDYLLFPEANRCAICKRECSAALCEDCLNKFEALKLEDEHSCYEYDGIARQIIYRFKFNGEKHLYKTIGALMANRIPQADVMTNVPVNEKRLKQRGYDQSRLIAQALCQETKITYISLLSKVKDTPAQSKLDARQRKENVKGAFKANDFDLSGKTVILVDDVITTGETMNECERELKEIGAKKVIRLSFAKTMI